MKWIPTKAPRHPINTACQAPSDNVMEWTAALLNGTYCVGDAAPALNASPKLPPVRLAPFGYDEHVEIGCETRERVTYPNRFCVVCIGAIKSRTETIALYRIPKGCRTVDRD